ncbi:MULTISPECIES: CHAT domain-containing tetratricopeptide repeat protein [unclassified Microcoleus]|uniref:CHAT domain-containing protein n=1 Tax=unclassified Microcoleus TaxID=2642155 RepID=UPI0025D17AAA|nr:MULTISPECIES: CHAT domain-containing tetratricopeptide repeat protein [unclassified Microcoleus]
MNESRREAYLDLINQLLNCQSGEAEEILNNNLELVDAGLAQIMLQESEELEQRGNSNFANFLTDIAYQLEEGLGLRRSTPTPKSQRDFLEEVLQEIHNTDGNRQIVYSLLRKNLDKLDENFATVLQNWATVRLPHAPAETQWIALDIGEFSNLMSNFSSGNQADNLEIAIVGYKVSLSVFTREAFRLQWATLQNNLGKAYLYRIREDKAENLELSIECYCAALEVRTREAFPVNWATLQNNLGAVYSERIEGDKADNMELAIACYRAALEVRTRENYEVDWSATQNNLGTAYSERIQGKKYENLELSIECYRAALEVRTRDNYEVDWAATQNNLGLAYTNRIEGDKADNLELSIECYRAALEVRTRENYKVDWAATQNNLGLAYTNRIEGDKADNLELSIECYCAALEVRTFENFPLQWATLQSNLAAAYSDRILGDRAENLEEAITSYKRALTAYTHKSSRIEWARINNNLGTAYTVRIREDKATNIEEAIKCYGYALDVYSPQHSPQDWAMTQNNLGTTYRHRILADKSTSLEDAIACYRAALIVYKRRAFPVEWANTQNNLGNVYGDRIEGDKAKNLEAAIKFYQNALSVSSREKFRVDWAMLQDNLGIAYIKRIRGDRSKNLEAAIRYYQDAREVRTREDFPQGYIATSFGLGFAYKQAQKFQDAYDVFYAAIDTVESLREEIISGNETKQKLAEEWHRIYLNMVEICLALGKVTTAIEYAERSKTRNLTENILTRDLKSLFPEKVVISLEKLRDEISYYQYKIQRGKAENYRDVTQHLKQLRQHKNELQDKYMPVGYGFKFREFQATLDNNTAIIEWYITNIGLETFVITSSSIQRLTLKTSAESLQVLEDWGNEYLKKYYGDKEDWGKSLASSLKNLADILHIEEIIDREEIKKCLRLILIPHRALHLFPLHALPLADGEFLCDKFPKGVSYAPSCQLLLQAQKRKRPDFTHLFAIQNPTKDRPYVDLGVEAIRPYFQPNDYVLPGEQAIKANLIQSEKLRSAHCFHFFGHATFNFEKSALILADGHLTLGEIFALDLNQCRLVILSACETGMTDFNSISDEYIGLPSGFLFAGSPSVVSTLWEVDQLSAAFLMIEFYENLRKYKQLEEGDIAIALNLSQKRLRDLTVDEFKKRLVQYKPLIDEILSKLPKVERRKAEASITYRLSQAYPFAHPSDWAAFTATGI